MSPLPWRLADSDLVADHSASAGIRPLHERFFLGALKVAIVPSYTEFCISFRMWKNTVQWNHDLSRQLTQSNVIPIEYLAQGPCLHRWNDMRQFWTRIVGKKLALIWDQVHPA